MEQMALFDEQQPLHIVNVASVTQRSPFRYPGGKTWLVPRIRQWLSPNIRTSLGLIPAHPKQFIEPFAGGGIISLTAAAENLADHVTMIEIDEDVAAVWQIILTSDHWEWLIHEIASFNLSNENVMTFLARNDLSRRERAFGTILKNRVNRGGILAPGAGLLKAGENGKGLRSRWYPTTLGKRIRDIVTLRDRITFVAGDGIHILRANAHHDDVAFFIDPPYTAAGKKAGSRLYRHAELDHEELFAIVSQLHGDFLMTYDNVEEVRALARQYNFDMQAVPMKNTHHAKMDELLIGPDLEWLRRSCIIH